VFLSGAFGEEVLRAPLHEAISQMPALAPHADTLALIMTVALITYFSVVLRELIPKQLAVLVSPLVWILSVSSHLLLHLCRLNRIKASTISDEEIRILMEMGAESGVFHARESQLVDDVMRLDDMRVGAIMVPRQEIFVIDRLDEPETQRRKIEACPYTQIVVCRDGFDHVLGILHCGDLLKKTLRDDSAFEIEQGLRLEA